MTTFIDTTELPEDQVTKFVDAVRACKHQDRVVYHVGPHCMSAPLRRWALGAYEAGLVVLAKERVGPASYNHYAIRTKGKFKHFVPAADA